MSQHSKVAITREGWYYLGMFGFIVAGAMIRDINLLYIMAGMMLGPLLFSLYASTKSLRGLSVRRRFQPLIGVGFPLYVDVLAEKAEGTSRAYSAIVHDRVRREGGKRRDSVGARLLLPHVAIGGSAETSWRTTFRQRGRYRLGPMRVSTTMPLGLIQASTGGNEDEWVLVSPRIGTVSPAWSRHLETRNDGGQRSSRRRGSAEGDFYGMREWRDGDSRNWIHWRTSAKRNKLTVRQYEQRINQDLVVILDLFQPSSGDGRDDIELAVSFAATLVMDYGRHGSTHLTVTSASEASFLLEGTSSPVLRHELMERLSMVEPTTKDSLPEVMARALSRSSTQARVVLVSTRDVDLNDTDAFDVVWKRTDIRRSLSDVVKVNTSDPKFDSWFSMEPLPENAQVAEESPEASSETPDMDEVEA